MILTESQQHEVHDYCKRNGLRACHLLKEPGKRFTAAEAAKQFLGKVGGNRDSVTHVGQVPRPDTGDAYEVYTAEVGHVAGGGPTNGRSHLMVASRYGTCWYVAFSPVGTGMLAKILDPQTEQMWCPHE